MDTAIMISVPFIGTFLGALSVFFLPDGLGRRTGKAISGFAAGVMIAASVWSLLIPSIESSSYIQAAVGFLSGVLLLLLLDSVVPHIHATAEKAEGHSSRLPKSALLMLAVTLHNIPEGMAVGAAAAAEGWISGPSALALSVGIALQNLPEGLIVALPLRKAGKSRIRAFLEGVVSGIVEPIGALIAFAAVSAISSIVPFFLAFAAGAMFYVVVEELIPEASEGEHSNAGTIGAALGFALMMVLDGIFS